MDVVITLAEAERRAMFAAFKAANGSTAGAAKLLGIHRRTIQRKFTPELLNFVQQLRGRSVKQNTSTSKHKLRSPKEPRPFERSLSSVYFERCRRQAHVPKYEAARVLGYLSVSGLYRIATGFPIPVKRANAVPVDVAWLDARRLVKYAMADEASGAFAGVGRRKGKTSSK